MTNKEKLNLIIAFEEKLLEAESILKKIDNICSPDLKLVFDVLFFHQIISLLTSKDSPCIQIQNTKKHLRNSIKNE